MENVGEEEEAAYGDGNSRECPDNVIEGRTKGRGSDAGDRGERRTH